MAALPMTRIDTDPNALTAVAIKALKTANSVCFFHDESTAIRGSIRCIKEPTRKQREADPFMSQVYSLDYTIGCASRISQSRLTTGQDEPKAISAYHMQYVYQDHWQTIIDILKQGDIIELVWGQDSDTSDSMFEKGFHGDSLTMKIVRQTKTLTFMLEIKTSLNGINRMTRQTQW